MTVKTWTLTDVASGVYLNEVTLGAGPGLEVTKRTLRGGLSDGVDVVRVRTGDLTYDVLPTRGMGIWKVWRKGQEIGWQSPVRGPVHPSFVPLMEPGGLGWLDGFDELLVRCGLESNGAPDFDPQGRLRYPLHGRIANRPAQRVEVAIDDATGQVTVTGVVEETRFHFGKLRMTSSITTQCGAAGLSLRDEVQNFSGCPAEMQLLYHINFGQPLLDPGARFLAPIKQVMPRDPRAAEGMAGWETYAPAVAGYAEQCYYLELQAGRDGRTQAMLKNADGTRGVRLLVDTRQLPYFTVWKNTVAGPDGYVTGLEPGTNFPNPRTYEGQQGRTVTLPPGGRTAFDLQLDILADAAEVAQAEAAIGALQAHVTPKVFERPQPGWCR